MPQPYFTESPELTGAIILRGGPAELSGQWPASDPTWLKVAAYLDARLAALVAAAMNPTTPVEERERLVARHDELRTLLASPRERQALNDRAGANMPNPQRIY